MKTATVSEKLSTIKYNLMIRYILVKNARTAIKIVETPEKW